MALGLRKISQRLLVTAFVTLVAALTALVFAPNQTLLILSKPLLASTDITLKELRGLEISFGEVSFDRLNISLEDNSIVLTGARIGFQLTELFKGKLDDITITETTLELVESKSNSPANEPFITPQQLAGLLAQANSIPFRRLELNSVRLTLDQYAINTSVSVVAEPLALQFSTVANARQKESLSLSGTFAQISEQEIEGSLLLEENGEEFLQSTMGLEITDTRLEFSSQSHAQMPLLVDELQEYLPDFGISHTSDILSLDVRLSSDQSTPTLVNFELAATDEAPVITLTQQLIDAEAETEIELLTPLDMPLTGSYDKNTQYFQLKIGDFDAELTGSSAGGLVSTGIAFKENSASCKTLIDCQLETSIAAISDIEFGTEEKLENFAASATIDMSWTNSVFKMTSNRLVLSLPTITGLDFKGSAEAQITAINLEQDLDRQTSIASAEFVVDQIKLDSSTVEIEDLNASGVLTLTGSSLEATTSLSLANQLNVDVNMAHNLTSGQGRADAALSDYSFSKITPLSNLLSLKDYNVEFIGGTISGTSEIQWQQSPQGALKIEGPVNLLLNDIAGYYDDLFFAGFKTTVNAELIDPMHLRTTKPLFGEIGTLDIGIPVNDINWGYSWEYSLAPENEFSVMSLDDFSAAILGGEVSAPSLYLDSRNSQSESNVVISNLNLESIVALADYPGLYVDGFISGYLPISITDSSITLTDGLISALNPGGTISYKPVESSAAVNSSLQLVNDALSNYRYDRLNTNVFYKENGDLTLAVQLQGFNPEMNQGQAINLNVNVMDNIPTLLKSLQASRSITDALEKTLNKR